MADRPPSQKSEYQLLKLRERNQDIPLSEYIEREISANITHWPEWFLIIHQNKQEKTRSSQQQQKVQRFNRYHKASTTTEVTVPSSFQDFDNHFKDITNKICKDTIEHLKKSIHYSISRFEQQPDYLKACQKLQSLFCLKTLQHKQEGLPLLDIWQPTRLAEHEVIPEVIHRITPEIEAVKSIYYPYNREKRCNWNVALVVRVQVQILKTLRDKVSRLVASAENHFQSFFVEEVLHREVLPLVRSSLNSLEFINSVKQKSTPLRRGGFEK